VIFAQGEQRRLLLGGRRLTAGSTGIMRGSYGGAAFLSPAGGARDIAAC
jgi:hypothetical protein